jgi:hypothetical protein
MVSANPLFMSMRRVVANRGEYREAAGAIKVLS